MSKISPYESGELTDSIFLILLAMLKPVHGYKIMQSIQKMTEGEVVIGPATMYTTLRKMKEAGWINETNTEDMKILYLITSKGKEILKGDYTRRKKIIKLAEIEFGGDNL